MTWITCHLPPLGLSLGAKPAACCLLVWSVVGHLRQGENRAGAAQATHDLLPPNLGETGRVLLRPSGTEPVVPRISPPLIVIVDWVSVV